MEKVRTFPSAEETRVPENRFRIGSANQAEIRMRRIQYEVVLSALGDDTWNSEYWGTALSKPTVPEGAGCLHVFVVPTRNGGHRYRLYLQLVRHFDAHHAVALRRLRQIGMHEHFEQGSGVGLSSVDSAKSDRVPPSTVQHGAGCVEDRMPGVGNAVSEHLYGKPEEELVQEIFDPTCAEFRSRHA